MSLNLYLNATFKENGKPDVVDQFDLYQTPTDTSYFLIKQASIKEAYIQWAMKYDATFVEPVYDPAISPDPAGYKYISPYKNHVQELERFLLNHTGWEIDWYVM